ncbi:MAG TPA: RNA polymerase subunit sigma-70, partial [Myxococcota bacterium]|nr:RNA polymerase subunit sigma-70 [Myxococcota bacterium]
MSTPSQHVSSTDLVRLRPALLAHCYRMMASQADAEDAVQETLLKAFKSFDRFEGRSSLKTWLMTIATRVCLDRLEQRKTTRRLLTSARLDMASGPVPLGELDTVPLVPTNDWVEPVPFTAADSDTVTSPESRLMRRESVRLAWVAALQSWAPRQRAALLMAEVLELSAAEIASELSTTVPAINSALQRAREMLSRRPGDGPEPRPIDQGLVERFVSAFERYDTEALTRILREDAVMSMPPLSIWLEGPTSIAAWLVGRGAACRGS